MQSQQLVEIQKEVTAELANEAVVRMLLVTTFKGLNEAVMPQAIAEGMLRGFTFKDFLERNIYAIPFGQTYSLVTSLDHARKVGMRSGIVGKDEPVYTMEEGLGLACSVTVHKRFADGYIGDFTAKVYLKEFTTGRNLWVTKERMMIAKVAEMHALRMACPEELAQSYVEEEMEREVKPAVVVLDIPGLRSKLELATTIDELKTAWAGLPAEAKVELAEFKEILKKRLEAKTRPVEGPAQGTLNHEGN